MQGPLKHIRAAALAAALLPLASVAAAPAAAEGVCQSGGVCGFVWNDTNNNGFFDLGETGLQGVSVFVCEVCDGGDTSEVFTDVGGYYSLEGLSPGTYTIAVLIPTGTQPSPGGDSDGVSNGAGYSVASNVEVTASSGFTVDFGFAPSLQQPGTGTPGYWKNHPEAWPVNTITVGGKDYSKADAIAWLGQVGKDKTTTMFSSLVPAILNTMIGNNPDCVSAAIEAAHTWMATYGPVGNKVAASSEAWSNGEPLHVTMDAYNNGRLCAPHRK